MNSSHSSFTSLTVQSVERTRSCGRVREEEAEESVGASDWAAREKEAAREEEAEGSVGASD